jgi:hypothetical protein
MRRLPRPSPAILIALLALFFALGGTAFALGSKVVPQPRCAQGAIRGIAVVTSSKVDLSSLSSSTYTSDPNVFGYRWSCTAGQIEVRRATGIQGVDVKFDGNPSTIAVVSAAGGSANAGSVTRQPDGSFRVIMGGSNTGAPGPWQAQWDVPFVIVLL